MAKPLVIGHRGAPNVSPENTLQSFESAIQLGADMFELDLQESSDGHLVIIHDYHVERISDHKGMVSNLSLKELQSIDLGNGAFIPTLEEVLDAFKGRIGINIDIKVLGIESKILDMVADRDMMNDVIFSSFFYGILAELKEIDLNATTAVLYEKVLDDPIAYALDLGASAINPSYLLIEPHIIEQAHQNNLQVYPWTVNDEDNMTKLIKMGVDGIITNSPDVCRRIVDQMNP
ncbi:MAG: glycerophosphodiester phosphodiesterase [Candidatus Thorarchaeota archaeon]|jgi:glycerophosphoryl diester phosphodiesterase